MNDHPTARVLLSRRAWIALVVGIIIGFLGIGLVRFFANQEAHTHYHANFAVFIKGQRQALEGPKYYQEIASCDAHTSPLGRVHLHDNNNHIVHVHDEVVTWADLFNNFGWSLQNSMLYDGDKVYIDSQEGELNFILNGQPTRSIANEIIGDEDRLLISFGSESDGGLRAQFNQIESDAEKANKTADPATCQGPEQTDAWSRLRRSFLW